MKLLSKRTVYGALLVGLCTSNSWATPPNGKPFSSNATDANVPPAYAHRTGSTFPAHDRSILIDGTSATLYMMEGGVVRDSMRVIVGKPSAQTPALKSSVHYATLNPYWNVPPDLVRTIIAPRVLTNGAAYLKERGYQVVSAYSSNAEVLPPDDVDWEGVAAGRAIVLVRQLPGPANSMGQIKFPLVTGDGIYLHDTPRKELFAQSERSLSNGCVRLEDAPRLARWLLGQDADLTSASPERHVALARAVPITITYSDSVPIKMAGAY